jgi:hypothetical protein
MDALGVSPEVLSPRQSRTLSVWEDFLEKHINREKLEPESKLQRYEPYYILF